MVDVRHSLDEARRTQLKGKPPGAFLIGARTFLATLGPMRLSARSSFACLVALMSTAIMPLGGCGSNGPSSGSDAGQPDTGVDSHVSKDAGHDAGQRDAAMTPDAAADVKKVSDGAMQDVVLTDVHADAPADGAAHPDGAPVDAAAHDGAAKDGADHDTGTKDAGIDAATGTKEMFHLFGRWDTTTTPPTMASANAVAQWPGSGIKATFTGPNIGIDLLEAPSAGGGGRGGGYGLDRRGDRRHLPQDHRRLSTR